MRQAAEKMNRALPESIYRNQIDSKGVVIPWDTSAVHKYLCSDSVDHGLRTTERALEASGLIPESLRLGDIHDERGLAPTSSVMRALDRTAKRKRQLSLIVQLYHCESAGTVLFANDLRKGRRWLYLDATEEPGLLLEGLQILAGGRDAMIWPHGAITASLRILVNSNGNYEIILKKGNVMRIGTVAYPPVFETTHHSAAASELPPGRDDLKILEKTLMQNTNSISHLDRLEADSIHIMREVMAQAENPVMMYSIGKDSAVMLHIAQKAFYPSPPPFPLLHVDTRWKFQSMYQFRDQVAANSGMDLIVHINPEGVEKNINPFDHGSSLHTDVMKTQGLKQALDKYGFDVAFGGARRDEEKSRAKERVFSFRSASHNWDPKNQRPELWNLYNGYKTKGESIRVFPLSNWTELDIWEYIYREKISIVPLYFAAERPVVERDGMLIMIDDDRIKLAENEKVQIKKVRFRTLGCYPLTGAVESDANDLPSIVLELLQSRSSERQGRAIDSDSSGSMEKKKQEGYF